MNPILLRSAVLTFVFVSLSRGATVGGGWIIKQHTGKRSIDATATDARSVVSSRVNEFLTKRITSMIVQVIVSFLF